MMKVIEQTMGLFQRPGKGPYTIKGKIRTDNTTSAANNPSRRTLPTLKIIGHQTGK